MELSGKRKKTFDIFKVGGKIDISRKYFFM